MAANNLTGAHHKKMSPSDKIISGTNSKSEQNQKQKPMKSYTMDSSPKTGLASTSDVTTTPGTISSIPLITASLSTLKCSTNDQMKTFDPGEEAVIERLANKNSEKMLANSNSSSSNSNNNSNNGLMKQNNKNYKAGSKINKLADMLAKRSQNVVEVTQNNSSNIISNISKSGDAAMTLSDISDVANFGKNSNYPVVSFHKTANCINELDLFKKSRRKSVPNQSSSFSKLEVQSASSKSCSDLPKLLSLREKNSVRDGKQGMVRCELNGKDDVDCVAETSKSKFNALGESLIKLQTDESTKRKSIRKNLKNIELTLILPEKKRRFSPRSDNHKIYQKRFDGKETIALESDERIFRTGSVNETSSVMSQVRNLNSTNSKRESKGKQRKLKKLVETSTQTADIEFIAVIGSKTESEASKTRSDGTKDSSSGGSECIRCSQILPLERESETYNSKHNVKPVIKCQFCWKKMSAVDELKFHYYKKHPDKYVHCLKCVAEEKLDKLSAEIRMNVKCEEEDEKINRNHDSFVEDKSEIGDDKSPDKNVNRISLRKSDLRIDVSCDVTKKSSVSPRSVQKASPKEIKAEEQTIEMEMLFYSHLSGNIRENLANHLDGKMGQNNFLASSDKVAGTPEPVTHSVKVKGLVQVASSAASSVASQDVPSPPRPLSPYRTRSKTPNPVPPSTAKKFKKLPNWQQKFWEKYNFPTNYRYEHRFWDKNYLDGDKSALLLKDLSCLDIKTQLIMRENIKRLESGVKSETDDETVKLSDSLKFPEYLFLVPKIRTVDAREKTCEPPEVTAIGSFGKSRRLSRKELPITTTKTRREIFSEVKRQPDKTVSEGGGSKMMTRRQNSLDLMSKEDGDESGRKRKGSLDSSSEKRMSLRRQASVDGAQRSSESTADPEKGSQTSAADLPKVIPEDAPLSHTGAAEISGEWVKPRSYLCGTCCAKFTNLWDLEDHKWVNHPNVWCTHYEFEDEKIEKLFRVSEEEKMESAVGENQGEPSSVRLADLYKRYLFPRGFLKTAKLVPSINFPEQCTKCKKNCNNLSEMHKHMLDCGGDTTWFLTMFSSPMTVKRKWRPFGSRRRKLGRRDLKRNIPNATNLRSYHYQHRIRTKPGDVESIQKMLANLPEKRARRAINFDDIKTRSQVTIHSNRILRKRFKSSFANNFLKMKTLKQRQLKPSKKERSSKSTTDTSSESTPVASPKRRHKLKELVQSVREESGADVSNESSSDCALSSRTNRRNQGKPNGSPPGVFSQLKADGGKQRKIPQEKIKLEKPLTRSHGSASNSPVDRSKKKGGTANVEMADVSTAEPQENQHPNAEETDLYRLEKKPTKPAFSHNEESSKESLGAERLQTLLGPLKTSKSKKKNHKKKAAGPPKSKSKKKKESKKTGVHSNCENGGLLKLKHPNAKEKTDAVKNFKERIMIEGSQYGSRRSLRLKSLQNGEESFVTTLEQQTAETLLPQKVEETEIMVRELRAARKAIQDEIKAEENSSFQRELRARRTDNFDVGKSKFSSINEKPGKTIQEKKPDKEAEAKEPEVPEKLRRSSRCLPIKKSNSVEDKTENDADKIYPSPPVLRRHSKNFSDDTETDESAATKRSSRLIGSLVDKSDSVLSATIQQPTTTKKLKLAFQGKDKMNNLEASKEETNENHDLEEMPVLAKVEPLKGKFYRKKGEEKDIPILMPAMEMEKSDANLESVRFHIVKKRKTGKETSSEVAPLKLIKRVGHSLRNRNADLTLRSEEKNAREINDIRKPNKRIPIAAAKEISRSEVKSKKLCKRCNQYFLGICPCEIDKGRGEENDSSEDDSDSKPLIMLLNRSQKIQQNATAIEDGSAKIEKEEILTSDAGNLFLESKNREGEKFSKEGEIDGLSENQRSPSAPILLPEKIKITRNEEFAMEKSEIDEEGSQNGEKNAKAKKASVKKAEKPLDESEMKPRASAELEEDIPPKLSPSISKAYSPEDSGREILPERRSRRISKETKSTSEFVIDDPLILVDELWSDLDSDSDSFSRKKSKKSRRKTSKKKHADERKSCDVNLEELLRNFGENKNFDAGSRKIILGENEEGKAGGPSVEFVSPVKAVFKVLRKKACRSIKETRRILENRITLKSFRRLSLKLFKFNKSKNNFGACGQRLSEAKMICLGGAEEKESKLPDLPFLATEIKENPVQVIQCTAQKSKPILKKMRKTGAEAKSRTENIHIKISLPLESINNMALFNNNHLTELDVEKHVIMQTREMENPEKIADDKQCVSGNVAIVFDESVDLTENKYKGKRSEVIDRIFYCEICQTYYYSSSQLKIHKLSNRHKIKEGEVLLSHQQNEPLESEEPAETNHEEDKLDSNQELQKEQPDEEAKKDSSEDYEANKVIEEERLNEDTLEMPTLEGPFLEYPVTRVQVIEPDPLPPPSTATTANPLKFCQDSLKDIQRAIGCTDEEMLILTLLGENPIELENNILDLDTGKPVQSGKGDGVRFAENEKVDSDKTNGLFKVDLKKRMTSALASLVNKAVFNLLQKYESVAKTSVHPEAVSLLGKLSSLSRRQNILQLSDLLKRQKDGESSLGMIRKDAEKKEPTLSYKYQCTICGSRFEKASTRECHISRSHKGKAKKVSEEVQVSQTSTEDDWNDYWTYDAGDISGNSSNFWCSDCGINFVSPQEVLEHQKSEHQAGIKDGGDRFRDAGPLQSSTIGSSDEILDGKKAKRRSKVYSSEELNQQRIIANNELRKLDRKFSAKNKSGKVKWGMDALKFTVEKDKNGSIEGPQKGKVKKETDESENGEETEKRIDKIDGKTEEPIPKLNFTRTNNFSEFKVIQKTSLKNRFQKIADNNLKRKESRHHGENQGKDGGDGGNGGVEDEEEECMGKEVRAEELPSIPAENELEETEETEVMLVPVVIKKKSRKSKAKLKKSSEGIKTVDVYDFNESESEGEPVVLSHAKKPMTLATKLKLIRLKEGPSKNKADSTTKDLASDDYDSEDSLPLSVVKKSKPGEEDEKVSEEDGLEKSDGILEQVEYLIEQLENETSSSPEKKTDIESEVDKKKAMKQVESDAPLESLKVSLASNLLTLPRQLNVFKDDANEGEETEIAKDPTPEKASMEQETSRSTFDEEDSLPLVLMSKRTEFKLAEEDDNEVYKNEVNATDIFTTTANDDAQTAGKSKIKKRPASEEEGTTDMLRPEPETVPEDVIQQSFLSKSSEGLGTKAAENVPEDVIFLKGDSLSNFESDFSNDGLIHSNYDGRVQLQTDTGNQEITEKEDVVIVCSKRDAAKSKMRKGNRKRMKSESRRRKISFQSAHKKKKRFPLLTATIEENNFGGTGDQKPEGVIVRKIWNRRNTQEENMEDEENSFIGPSCADEEDTSLELASFLQNEESQSEIQKEIIVNKIWSRRKVDHENEFFDKSEGKLDDVKIKKTEISDEVIIKCGPKTIGSPKKKQRSKSVSNESSKETIMRKIWSGKCMFQTKAALKTYDSDVLPGRKEQDALAQVAGIKTKKRGRPARFASTSTKKMRLENEKNTDEDDLDSLLEEIEREQLEKAIRLEFLQLRRSEKGSVEIAKEGTNSTLGLFTETSFGYKRDGSDKKRKNVRKNVSRHPRQSLLKRKKFMKKTIRRIVPAEGKCFTEKLSGNQDSGFGESQTDVFISENGKTKNRKHKKHRHKHHHHKHKHKKSKHRKCLATKHKTKNKSVEEEEEAEGRLEGDVNDAACRQAMSGEAETEASSASSIAMTETETSRLIEKICQNVAGEIDPSHAVEMPSPFSFEDSTKDCEEIEPEEEAKEVNVYEFAEDASDLSTDAYKSRNLRETSEVN